MEPPRARSAGRLLRRRQLGAFPLATCAALGLAACGDGGIKISFPTPAAAGSAGGTRAIGASLVANPAKDEWPQDFWQSSAEVQEAYRFALSHQDILQYMPCFCGCVNQ